MKNVLKIASILLFVVVALSCTSAKTGYKSSDFVGKTFSVKGDNTPAQLGGKQTFHFNDDKMLDYKMGDMMNMATYVVEGNKIRYTDRMTSVTRVLEIVDTKTLKDEHNVIWNAE